MPLTSRVADVFRLILPGILAVGALSCVVGAYPEPAAVPFRWEVDFKSGDLRLYVDAREGAAYWYFTYNVVNRTGDDQIWAPSFALFTDHGEILQSGRDVPTRVEEDIRALLGNPLLETQNEAIGDLFQGLENAKDGLVVWPARETGVNDLSMFVAGISGETARVMNPVTDAEVILRKTLHRRYLIRGDALARGSQPVEFVDQRWIMR